MLTLLPEDPWVVIYGSVPKGLVEFLKYKIIPHSYRRFDPDRKVWLLHWQQLRVLVAYVRRSGLQADWSALPPEWQIFAVGGQANSVEPVPVPTGDPHAVLFVTPEAPMEVIKAAYRALATMYHPDVGGDAQKMTSLNQAYDEICQRAGRRR